VTAQIVGSVLYGADMAVAEWATTRLGPVLSGRKPDVQVALGVVRGNEIAAAFLFFNYRPEIDIEVSVASDNADWCRPATLRRLFDYPFRQLNLPRMTSIVARDNKRCRKLCEGVGWKLEGVARKAYDGRKDAMIYGMLREEARFWKA
jgi:hypothetical protein